MLRVFQTHFVVLLNDKINSALTVAVLLRMNMYCCCRQLIHFVYRQLCLFWLDAVYDSWGYWSIIPDITLFWMNVTASSNAHFDNNLLNPFNIEPKAKLTLDPSLKDLSWRHLPSQQMRTRAHGQALCDVTCYLKMNMNMDVCCLCSRKVIYLV